MKIVRRKLKGADRVLPNGRVLTQMYERLFPDPADRMYFLRKSLNMSQRQLAEECGVSAGVFSNVECGYGLPKGTTLIKIAKGMSISTDYILNLSDRQELERKREAKRA